MYGRQVRSVACALVGVAVGRQSKGYEANKSVAAFAVEGSSMEEVDEEVALATGTSQHC